MKSIGGYVAGGLVLAALGAVALAGGLIEHRIAHAKEALASLDFGETAAAYDKLEQYVAYARYMPWIAGDALNRIRARRAAVRYWEGDHDALLPVTRDASAGEQTDPELLFIAANATYRLGQKRAADRASMLRALDDARGAYQVVLRESTGHADAAFNYEYLALVRDEIAKGRRRDELAGLGKQTLHGREGGPPPAKRLDEFKILVPEEDQERQRGKEAGGDQLRRRRG